MLGTGGAIAAMDASALYIDHTTVSPAIARRIADTAAERGVPALDAPVSGGQAGAENGKLAIMCGGSDEAMSRARPVMEACFDACWKYYDEVAAKNPGFKKILDSLAPFRMDQHLWFRVAEFNFDSFNFSMSARGR